jgi:phosphopentomutase
MQAIVLVIDSFGLGVLPDAGRYGDTGANTAMHICEAVPGKKWPMLQALGLGNCAELLGHYLPGCGPARTPLAGFGVMAEASPGKDTTTGHWEIAGIELVQPFHTFPPCFPSFPDKLVADFQEQTGFAVLGNRAASGTAIIQELGGEHMKGRGIIVYTSADSVLQIAAHEELVPVQRLYQICEIARRLCDPYNVARVIARPFTGRPGEFKRTERRKDFSMPPPQKTILDHLQAGGVHTVGIGKIGDIFMEQGLDASFHDAGNTACLDRTLDCMEKAGEKDQFVFTNLVDTDMLFGHRRDIKGYLDAVQAIDDTLPRVMGLMTDQDLLVITADHGCDPGFKGTDHTREYVPLLAYQKQGKPKNLGIRTSFCDVAQSLAFFFKIPAMARGSSFL